MFCGKHHNFLGIDPKVLGERVARFLRQAFPNKTAVFVSAHTGYSVTRVEKWLDGTAFPNGIAIFALLCAFGPEFIKAALGEACPAWIDAAHIDAKNDHIEQTISELRAQQESLNAR
jgi:hypothetical protein